MDPHNRLANDPHTEHQNKRKNKFLFSSNKQILSNRSFAKQGLNLTTRKQKPECLETAERLPKGGPEIGDRGLELAAEEQEVPERAEVRLREEQVHELRVPKKQHHHVQEGDAQVPRVQAKGVGPELQHRLQQYSGREPHSELPQLSQRLSETTEEGKPQVGSRPGW